VRGVTQPVTERFDGRPLQLYGQAVSRLIMVSFPARGASREEGRTIAFTALTGKQRKSLNELGFARLRRRRRRGLVMSSLALLTGVAVPQ
jgi:hypothetical protein